MIMDVSRQTLYEWACIIFLFTFMCLQITSELFQLLTVPVGKVSNIEQWMAAHSIKEAWIDICTQ